VSATEITNAATDASAMPITETPWLSLDSPVLEYLAEMYQAVLRSSPNFHTNGQRRPTTHCVRAF